MDEKTNLGISFLCHRSYDHSVCILSTSVHSNTHWGRKTATRVQRGIKSTWIEDDGSFCAVCRKTERSNESAWMKHIGEIRKIVDEKSMKVNNKSQAKVVLFSHESTSVEILFASVHENSNISIDLISLIFSGYLGCFLFVSFCL